MQDLVALAFAARKTVVEVTLGEGTVNAETIHPLGQIEANLKDAQLIEALTRGDGLTQKLDDRNTTDRLRVLKREKDSSASSYVRRSL